MSKLILTQEVSGLGSAGDVVEVKGGYARNFLVPTGRAVTWTRGGEKQIEGLKAARLSREAASIEEAQHTKDVLEARPVTVAVRTGQAGRLFGSVSAADVVDAIQAAGLTTVDRRSVELVAPIRAVGTHEAIVRLRSDVVAQVTVEVVANR